MTKLAVGILQNRLQNVLDIHKESEDLTNAEVIGVLEVMKLDIYNEIRENIEDSEDDNG